MKPEELMLYRAQSNCTQDKFADILGVNVRTLRRWESGHVRVPDTIAVKLRAFFQKQDTKPDTPGGGRTVPGIPFPVDVPLSGKAVAFQEEQIRKEKEWLATLKKT